MTSIELARVWPEYWATHDISLEELGRIAHDSLTPAEAYETWSNETWWKDTSDG